MTYSKQDFGLVAGSFLLVVAIISLISLGFRAGLLVGHSMEPTFYPGDIYFCTPEPSYEEGDVALFENEKTDKKVAHKVVHAKNGVYKTSGDNNEHVDRYDVLKKDEDFICSFEAIIHTGGEGKGFISLDI